jgi:hypothetical protein
VDQRVTSARLCLWLESSHGHHQISCLCQVRLVDIEIPFHRLFMSGNTPVFFLTLQDVTGIPHGHWWQSLLPCSRALALQEGAETGALLSSSRLAHW